MLTHHFSYNSCEGTGLWLKYNSRKSIVVPQEGHFRVQSGNKLFTSRDSNKTVKKLPDKLTKGVESDMI